MKPKLFFMIAVLLLAIAAVSCDGGGGDDKESKPGIANPASVFCEEQGGTLEIRDEEGGQVGYCIFEDGSECEEWAYFKEECEPGDYYP